MHEAATREAADGKIKKALDALGLQASDCLTTVTPDGSLRHRTPRALASPSPKGGRASLNLAPPASYPVQVLTPHEQVLGAFALGALHCKLLERTSESSRSGAAVTGSPSTWSAVSIELPAVVATLLHGTGEHAAPAWRLPSKANTGPSWRMAADAARESASSVSSGVSGSSSGSSGVSGSSPSRVGGLIAAIAAAERGVRSLLR